jgi:hypothetical protein
MCASHDAAILSALARLGQSGEERRSSAGGSGVTRALAELGRPPGRSPSEAAAASPRPVFPTSPSKGSQLVAAELQRLGVSFSREVAFSDCRDKRLLKYDFQIVADGKLGLIEYDGAQHFRAVGRPGESAAEVEANFLAARQRDLIKTVHAFEQHIPFLRLADDLKPGEISLHVGHFVRAVREGKRGVAFAANDRSKYGYLEDYEALARSDVP